MDETGCSLAAEPTYSWCPSGQPVCVPKRAGKPSRVNVIGGLGLCGGRWRLEWQVVEGRVNAETVVAWLERLAARASRARPVVVVWDRASYHTARVVESRFGSWASRGLFVYVLPAYSPQLNLVERCWLELKARLLPRRWYADVCALRAGVEAGLEALAAQVEQGLYLKDLIFEKLNKHMPSVSRLPLILTTPHSSQV